MAFGAANCRALGAKQNNAQEVEIMSKFRFIQTVLFTLIIALGSCKDDNPTKAEDVIYKSKEVNFESEGLTLEGTLYLPNETSKVPAVIIVNGSGPVDRDGIYAPDPNLLPPIYKNWADWIASRGIGVLRYDKRFLTHPNLNPLEISQDDQITDIVSAINYLKSCTEIDTNKILIIGHSEGGNIAPIAVQRKNVVVGVVIIASPSFAIDTLFIEQLKANPNNPQTLITQVEMAFELLRNNQFPSGGQIFGGGEAYWREWIEYSENAGSIAINLGKPILVIQGEEDENFPGFTLQKNKTLWGNTASQSDLIDFRTYKGVTHLILTKDTQDMATDVLDDIVNWIKQN